MGKGDEKTGAILARLEAWVSRVAAPRLTQKLQDVLDYPIHSLSVVLNNLRQTSICAFSSSLSRYSGAA
jgi:hypothetical protein